MPNTPTARHTVATLIKAAMAARDVSLNALADSAGIPPSSLSRYLRGITSPTIDHLALIADALDLPLADLMPGSDAA